jgi:hypothetical protein
MKTFLAMLVLLFSSEMNAQVLPDLSIPDSAYVENELLVWFKPGVLNKNAVGGYGEMIDYPHSDQGKNPMPIDTALIRSIDLAEYLVERGVLECEKVVPWIDPFCDTVSITRSGDTISVRPYWNLLLLRYDPSVERNMIEEAYLMLYGWHHDVLWSQTNT